MRERTCNGNYTAIAVVVWHRDYSIQKEKAGCGRRKLCWWSVDVELMEELGAERSLNSLL